MWKAVAAVGLVGCSFEGKLQVGEGPAVVSTTPTDATPAEVVDASFTFGNTLDTRPTEPPSPPPVPTVPTPPTVPSPPPIPTVPSLPPLPTVPSLPPLPTVPSLPPGSATPPSCAATPNLAQCVPGVAAVAGTPFSTIQAAIDSGASEVSVCPGTWDVSLTMTGGTLRSASGSPSDTMLSGAGTHPMLEARDVSIVGLGFTGGVSSYAGGAVSLRGVNAIACSVFEGNRADYQGGAISARGDLTVHDTHFLSNHAGYEGGAISWGERANSTLTVTGSVFHGNTADYSGQAVELGTWGYDAITFSANAFSDNTGTRGVLNFGSWGGFDGVVDGCTFDETSTAIEVGGWNRDGYTMSVTGTTFTGPSGSW